jgi:hypothetical protein
VLELDIHSSQTQITELAVPEIVRSSMESMQRHRARLDTHGIARAEQADGEIATRRTLVTQRCASQGSRLNR